METHFQAIREGQLKMETKSIAANPFSITKADDYNDRQIQQFWVDGPAADEPVQSVVQPKTAMPKYLLGAKGSGKTHLLRFHSFPLQKIRLEKRQGGLLSGVKEEGYLGIYIRCGGLNAGRFAGKRQPEDRWEGVFAYYLELWLTRHLLQVVQELEPELEKDDVERFVREAASLFDVSLQLDAFSLHTLIAAIESERRHLDVEVNNCVLSGSMNVQIKVAPGRLVFGIPKCLVERCPALREVTVVYLIDELENLSKYQQRIINSLVRDRELPTTFRIGARLYGIKTLETFSSEEENLPDSEFVRVVLDEEMRRATKRYDAFARSMLRKRLSEAAFGMTVEVDSLQRAFSVQDETWSSEVYLRMVKGEVSRERTHFRRFRQKLRRAGIQDEDGICEALAQFEYPLIEKASILAFYRRVRRGDEPKALAEDIREQAEQFMKGADKGRRGNRVRSIIEHNRTDLSAQLCRENRSRQYYLGLKTFIIMSGGLPRVLLTIMRSIFEWAIYNGEDPMQQDGISIDSQYRGVMEATEWFFSSMRKSGREGAAIQVATERLAQIFRESRFSDLPIECSLNTFSISLHQLSEEARYVLDLCEQRSFINEVSGGQKHRNSKEVQLKYQLHPMLCPRWQLPIGRRGAMVLSSELGNAVFEPGKQDVFAEELKQFRRARRFALKPREGELF